jgi:hypothetical protein
VSIVQLETGMDGVGKAGDEAAAAHKFGMPAIVNE